MKKIITAVISVLVLVSMLASCGHTVPEPEIKEGKFDVSVTYEVNGEVETLDLVYVCEYDGVHWTLEGNRCRTWTGHFEGYEEGDAIEVYKTEDGDKIQLCFLIYAEYFMGEPDYVEYFYPDVLVERVYFEDGVEMIDSNQELLAEEYGARVISVEYDEPIENSFGTFN